MIRIIRAAALAAALPAAAAAQQTPADDLTALIADRAFDEARVICDGAPVQGGFLICSTPRGDGPPLAMNGGVPQEIETTGYAFFPIGRDETGTVEVMGHGLESYTAEIETREFNIQRIDGLPPSSVRARTPEEQARVAEGVRLKNAAWEHRAEGAWWIDGFRAPLETEARQSGVYGSQRILNSEPNSPHYGIDYAVGTGTPILAPAAGEIVLAQPDMYFEGGLVVIDHGAGVMGLFMHMSQLDVEEGQFVEAGQKVGEVGSTGRSTGPHLHWGLRVRGTYIDPELALAFDPRESATLAMIGRLGEPEPDLNFPAVD